MKKFLVILTGVSLLVVALATNTVSVETLSGNKVYTGKAGVGISEGIKRIRG